MYLRQIFSFGVLCASLLLYSSAQADEEKDLEPQEPTPPEVVAGLMNGRLPPTVSLDRALAGELDRAGALFDEGRDELSPKYKAALRAWQRLSPNYRRKLVEVHQTRRQEFLREQGRKETKEKRAKEIRERATNLQAYLSGELNLQIAPEQVLLVDATDWLDVDEPHAELVQLRKLQAKYLALTDVERQKLLERHQKRAEAEAIKKKEAAEAESQAGESVAAQEKAKALQAAEQAASELSRALHEEKARLFGYEEKLQRFQRELREREKQNEKRREEVLRLAREAREFLNSNPYDPGREARASTLYDSLVSVLEKRRAELAQLLSSGTNALKPPQLSDLVELDGSSELDVLRAKDAELRRLREMLAAEGRLIQSRLVASLRDAVVALNEQRLHLLSELSASRRSAMSGVGPAGVAQISRELKQISLEARFHLLTTRQSLRSSFRQQDTLVAVFALLKVIAVILLMRLWRRRAPSVLNAALDWGRQPSSAPFGAIVESVAWYGERLRAPIEWYVLAQMIFASVNGVIALPEVNYLNEVVTWACLGSLVVRWVDALASSRDQALDPGQLRFRSLRLVAVWIVSVMLLLRLSELSVGRGTLYTWVVRASFLLSAPLLLRLLLWWRPEVLKRLNGISDPGGFLRWAQKQGAGPTSLVVTLVFGARFLGFSIYRRFLRRISKLQAAQQLLAYLFRRELEKRANGQIEEYGEPTPEQLSALQAATATPPEVTDYASDELQQCASFVDSAQGGIVAVVGERGIGKSRFGARILEARLESSVGIRCSKPGYSALLDALHKALGGEGASSEESVRTLLAERERLIVWIDDATRLIRPLIGGLRHFDQLAHLARDCGSEVTWLLGVSTPAWNYLSRAREDRAVVDLVIRLPRWSADQIGELARLCTVKGGLSVRYDDLVVPNQLDEEDAPQAAERSEQDYARLLTEFSGGNPLVAMHFFVRSIRERGGELFVRLFHSPPAAELEEHPSSVLFVLRAALQLGLSTEPDIAKCTGLSMPDVADALRLCRGRQYVEVHDGRYRISVYWLRMIIQVLRRQHLILEAS